MGFTSKAAWPAPTDDSRYRSRASLLDRSPLFVADEPRTGNHTVRLSGPALDPPSPLPRAGIWPWSSLLPAAMMEPSPAPGGPHGAGVAAGRPRPGLPRPAPAQSPRGFHAAGAQPSGPGRLRVTWALFPLSHGPGLVSGQGHSARCMIWCPATPRLLSLPRAGCKTWDKLRTSLNRSSPVKTQTRPGQSCQEEQVR